MRLSSLRSRISFSFLQPCASQSYSIAAAATDNVMTAVLAANVYLSEGRNTEVIQKLRGVAEATAGVALVNVFVDGNYHRTGFTLAACESSLLSHAILQLSGSALEHLDLATHSASHPRLGVVDHISVSCLGYRALRPTSTSTSTSRPDLTARTTCRELRACSGPGRPSCSPDPALQGLQMAADCATAVAQQLGASPRLLPCYLYGAAHPQQRRLADVRRALGYFVPDRPNVNGDSPQALSSQDAGGTWEGTPPMCHTGLALYPPDTGQSMPSKHWGVAMLGAVPWSLNYNVPVHFPVDADSKRVGVDHLLMLGKVIAKRVSERGGGLAGVEAMALLHEGGGCEIACNLLDPTQNGPGEVQERVEQLAAEAGTTAGLGYLTNKTAEQLMELTLKQLGVSE